MHLVLRAGIAVELQDATAVGLVQQLVDASGRYGFIHTVVASTTQVTSYLLERSAGLYQTPHLDRLLAAAIDTRANQAAAPARRPLIDPLTERELTVLRLLPTSLSAPQIASKLYVSLNTIKTHLRRIYMKLDPGRGPRPSDGPSNSGFFEVAIGQARILAFCCSKSALVMTPRSLRSASLASSSAVLVPLDPAASWTYDRNA